MKKLPLCLTAVTCFSLLNVATADPMSDCGKLINASQYREALPFCQEACNLNYGLGCVTSGWLYGTGQGVRQDSQQAKTYYEKACNLNEANGCNNLGFIYDKGQGVRQDSQRAVAYYDKACNMNSGTGCDNLGYLYDKGQGIRQDSQQAITYYEKACSLKYGKGCGHLGNLYTEGHGVKQDYQQAREYYKKACDLNEGDGCDNLVYLYYRQKEEGWDVSEEYWSGEYYTNYFRKSCEQNNRGIGCYLLGDYYQHGSVSNGTKDLSAAKYYHKKACDLNVGMGCAQLGYLTWDLQYLEKSCDMNVGFGCNSIGYLYVERINPDYQQGKKYYEKACDLNYAEGCFRLGRLYGGGNLGRVKSLEQIEEDLKFRHEEEDLKEKERSYYKKACDLNYWEGCSKLVWIYETGYGVRKDYQKAKAYAKKTCDLDSRLCDKYKRLNEIENKQGY